MKYFTVVLENSCEYSRENIDLCATNVMPASGFILVNLACLMHTVFDSVAFSTSCSKNHSASNIMFSH